MTRIFFLCLSGSGKGNSSIYVKRFISIVGKNGLVGMLEIYQVNNAISSSKIGDFMLYLFKVGQVWHTIAIYSPAISYVEPHILHMPSYHFKVIASFLIAVSSYIKGFRPLGC